MTGAVLVVEDDRAVRMLLRMLLEDEGFDVIEADGGTRAIEAAQERPFDLVLLDLRLPERSGYDVCREIRRSSDVPIIMLTAQQDSHDIVAGLECGADDYVTKPYNDYELMARIRVQMRKRTPPPVHAPVDEVVLTFGNVEIRPRQGFVARAGTALSLTKTEFLLLIHLAESPNRVFSREQLLEAVWDYSFAGDGRLVDTHIRRLRVKVEHDPQHPSLIQTVRGLGYKLVG